AAVAVSVNGPYTPEAPPSAAAQFGVQTIWPVLVLNVAPAGSAGLTDHVSGPLAHGPGVGGGAMVSVASSATVCGSPSAATATDPNLWGTSIFIVLLEPTSSVAAVDVSVNGP